MVTNLSGYRFCLAFLTMMSLESNCCKLGLLDGNGLMGQRYMGLNSNLASLLVGLIKMTTKTPSQKV